MRWRAQHLLTEELGPRLDHEIDRQLDREVAQERLTSIDRRLAKILGSDQTTDVARLAVTTGAADRRRIVGRLQVLETMQLAERTSPRSWCLAANWQTALQQLGERGDVIRRIHRALGAAGDPARILAEAKSFLKWCVGKRWIARNPLEGVIGMGKRRHGKVPAPHRRGTEMAGQGARTR